MITHLDSEILECKVKWALGSITTNKASGGDGIPVKLFQILKDDIVKVLHPICQQIWKTQQWTHNWKKVFSFQSQRKAMSKTVQTTTQLHSSHMLANSQNSPSQASTVHVNRELPVVQAGFRKGRGTRDQIANIHWSSNQCILKEISPGCSLEGLMLKLKLQYFGHLMWRADSLEKTLMLGKTEGMSRRGRQRMRWLNGIID